MLSAVGVAVGYGCVDTYCGHCGEWVGGGGHAECAAARELEPPRYCPTCRRRMAVQVTPGGWRARCSRHGTYTGAHG